MSPDRVERLAYSPEEAAQALGVSRPTVYKLMGLGSLDSFKVGRRRLIARGALDRLVEPEGWVRVTDRSTDEKPTGSSKKPMRAELRRRVFERDAYRCVHCGSWEDLCVDHIHPQSRGGATAFENLQTLCRSCNSSKGAS